MTKSEFRFVDERFADIQLLRYELKDFDTLSIRQKCYIYCLSQATLFGRDITFDQFGAYNLRIRKIFEAIYSSNNIDRTTTNFKHLELYLKKIWFANGIYHHYSSDKFIPDFSSAYLQECLERIANEEQFIALNERIETIINEILPIIFDPTLYPKKVNKDASEDIILTSACNYYKGITQKEVECFYNDMKNNNSSTQPISYGLNSTLIKEDGKVYEDIWKLGGKYSKAIEKIIYWLEEAKKYTENAQQEEIISALITYYQSGNLSDFDTYSILWVKETAGIIDFINGFIEVYNDPLGLKGSWEGIVHYKDLEATKRAKTISENAQWFEDNSPTNPLHKKKQVKGVTANVVRAAMLGGDEYPSTAIGINLPNADWIRAEYGSKSVTISNLTSAYNIASKGSGMLEEFVIDEETYKLIKEYGHITDDLHTDLHECLGHGSGQLCEGTDPDALKNYGNTIEETRADLFGLYYIADPKLLKLNLLDSKDAFKAQYYTYIMNGLLTQLVRIEPGKNIEESHMQNRALIANWAKDLGSKNKVIELIKCNENDTDKTYVKINNYEALRRIFAEQLYEIQRIKSEGDYEAAKILVEKYGIKVEPNIHKEVLERYQALNLAPYKGFINPILKPIYNQNNEIIDVEVDYSESYSAQMIRYSNEYATL